MIDCRDFFVELEKNGIGFYSGVPDSLLKDFCAYANDRLEHRSHIIAVNEGAALSMAAGYNLATGHTGLVYLQNSGLGNIVNPLLSLCDERVYSIPALLIIGWRGQPGEKDEPQHVQQGRVTLPLLEAMEIPHCIIDERSDWVSEIGKAMAHIRERSSPYAVIVKKGTFASYTPKARSVSISSLRRERALELCFDAIMERDSNAALFSTTGKTSRELYEISISRLGRCDAFLNVGSMGHLSSLALSAALAQPEKSIFCIDGDGAMLMHMGALATIGSLGADNFKHIMLNNSAHESVGGQPTVAGQLDIHAICTGCGYSGYFCAASEAELRGALPEFLSSSGPSVLEIKIDLGSRKDLGRPLSTPKENRDTFIRALNRQ